MRFGVRVTETLIAGVYVCADGSSGAQSVQIDGFGIVEAFDRLMDKLLNTAEVSHRAEGDPVAIVTFELSDVLVPESEQLVTTIRIAPRPPIEPSHELNIGSAAMDRRRVVHIRGGHTKLGEELVPLDVGKLQEFAADVPSGGRFVVTSVGAQINSAHELTAGTILLEYADPASVNYSHSFYNSSFGTRERTAVTNSSLIPSAESLATSLVLVAGQRLPNARLFVTTNDGGCVPLARLSVTPVHSMFSARPSTLIGAAALGHVDNGRIMVIAGSEDFIGEMLDGVPAVRPQLRTQDGYALASKSANLLPATPSLLTGRVEPPIVVAALGAPDPSSLEHPVDIRATVDLGALGAACAPATDWLNRVVIVRSATELQQSLIAAEARVRSRLVAFGAANADVRIVESRVIAAPYENQSIVGLRVRGVAAGKSVGEILVRERSDAPD